MSDSTESDGAIILAKRDGDVLELTLNRPAKRNALAPVMVERLLDELTNASADSGVRLLIVRGAGRGFCAGFDFSDVKTCTDGDLALRLIRVEQLLQAIHYAPFATLALAHGACFGAGADIVAACQRRVVAPDATFRMPGLRFGIVLGTRRLANLVGTDNARSLLETTRVFDANEALRLGFASTVSEIDAWPDTIADATVAAQTLDPEAQQQLLERTRLDTRNDDLAALARSVARPGLRDRISAFVAAAKRG